MSIKQLVTSTYNSFGSEGLKVNSYPAEYWQTIPMTLNFHDDINGDKTATHNVVKMTEEINKDLSVVGFLTKIELFMSSNILVQLTALGIDTVFFSLSWSQKDGNGNYTSNIDTPQLYEGITFAQLAGDVTVLLENTLTDGTDLLGSVTGRDEEDFSENIKDVKLLMWYGDNTLPVIQTDAIEVPILNNLNATIKITQEA